MRVAAADSGAAFLDENYEPMSVIASAAVVVEPPYRTFSWCVSEEVLGKPIGRELIVKELNLCLGLLKKSRADVVHLDMSLNGTDVLDLTSDKLYSMRMSTDARKAILDILPEIRRLATEIKQKYEIRVLAAGKDSIPVRIAELASGANAVIYASKRALKEKSSFTVGLPRLCGVKLWDGGVSMSSLVAGEHDVYGFAFDSEKILFRVNVREELNPCVRGFRVVRISPKSNLPTI